MEFRTLSVGEEEALRDELGALIFRFGVQNRIQPKDIAALALMAGVDQVTKTSGDLAALDALASCLTYQIGVLQRQGVDVGLGLAVPVDRLKDGEEGRPLRVADVAQSEEETLPSPLDNPFND